MNGKFGSIARRYGLTRREAELAFQRAKRETGDVFDRGGRFTESFKWHCRAALKRRELEHHGPPPFAEIKRAAEGGTHGFVGVREGVRDQLLKSMFDQQNLRFVESQAAHPAIARLSEEVEATCRLAR